MQADALAGLVCLAGGWWRRWGGGRDVLRVRGQLAVRAFEYGAFAAAYVHDALQGGAAIAAAYAFLEGAHEGEQDEGQVPQGAAYEHEVKVQRLAAGVAALAQGGRLDDVGPWDLAEVLQGGLCAGQTGPARP